MQQHIVLKPGPVTGSTITNTASSLTTPETDTVLAIIAIETNDVRMRWDGVDPVAGPGGGLLMKKDSIWEVTSRDDLVAMRFVAESSDAYVVCAEQAGE